MSFGSPFFSLSVNVHSYNFSQLPISCSGNLTLEMIVFKLSCLRNQAVYFVETCTVMAWLFVLGYIVLNGFEFRRLFGWNAVQFAVGAQ